MPSASKTPGLSRAKAFLVVLLAVGICYLGWSVFQVLQLRNSNPGNSRKALDALYGGDATYMSDHPVASQKLLDAEKKYGKLKSWKVTDFTCTGLWNAPCTFTAEVQRDKGTLVESGTLAGSGLVNYQVSEKR